MDGEAKKRRSWRPAIIAGMVVVLAAVLLLLAGGAGFRRTDPARAEVLQILQSTNRNFAEQLRRLTVLGPKALPTLAELIAYHESGMHARYRKLLPKLPVSLRKHLGDPLEYHRLHTVALQLTHDLGPAFIRPLTSSLCKVKEDPSMLNNVIATACLYWSVPDSPEATARMCQLAANPTNELSVPPQGFDAFWSRLPQTAPYFAARLTNQSINTALSALMMMGTNAAPAVPALIELCRRDPSLPGAVPPSTMTNLPPFLTPAMMRAGAIASLEQSRSQAFRALGKIGIKSDEVMAAIRQGMADTNETVVFGALAAWMELGQPPGTNLAGFMVLVTPRATPQVINYLQWTGTLGPEGREALPWLRQFTSMDYVKSLPTKEPEAVVGPSPAATQRAAGQATVAQDQLRKAAIVAICRIEPEEIVHYLPDLAGLINRTEVLELLAANKAHAAEITAALEPALNGTGALQAAYIILGFTPDQPQAMHALRSRVEQGPLDERIRAASWWFKRTGESRDLLALADEGLRSPLRGAANATLVALKDLGPAARPTVPALKAALLHPETMVRVRAGALLWQIAPEEMPPVH